ncbi:MAG: hypothetical protein GTO46_11675 [Gemmatimonadetes bacterium]|nr:hypothetical protein [Gemmatimonadota bacterium]NIO32248.1 hypothetical protein [Gemmatimonadota bacterium]
MGGSRKLLATATAVACFFAGTGEARGQVVAEPALLTAGIPTTEIFLPYIAFPENAYVFGGMLRFPVSDDVDIGGRAGLWLIDDAKDSPFAGGDLRYNLLSRPLSPGGGQLALSFNVGLGISDPGVTVWKIPVGFIAGIGFVLAGGDSEIFVHPRFDLGLSSGADSFDAELLLDVGGLFSITRSMGVMLDVRFGEGPYAEGDQAVLALGVAWRL